MWYRIASLQDEIEKLRTQGIDETILSLFSDPKYDNAAKGKMLGAIKQNPNITIEELKNLSSQNKPTIAEQVILSNFENERFKNWLFHKLKGWRIHPQKPNGEYDHNLPAGDVLGNHANFIEFARHIQDFVINIIENDPDYNLGLKTWDEVVEDTNNWEAMLQGRGTGKFYNPDDREVVMAYPDGWNMVRVNSENDLDVEGAKMHHCVAGYWDQVRRGNVNIYSLRTPSNQPMVTIEIRGNKVIQVKGHSNAKVTDQDLVDKVRDFFDEQDDIQKESKNNPIADYFEDWEERIDWHYSPDELEYAITFAIYGPDESEYEAIDDDDIGEDFNRFGIISPVWDHERFAENNLDSAYIPDILENIVREIKDGISPERNRYVFIDSDKITIDKYPIDDYVDTLYGALVDKALLSLKRNSQRHEFEKYLDVNNVLSTATEKYKKAQEEYEESEKKVPFMQWYEKQPEYIYFLLANKIENFFEKSKFAFDYKEKTGNTYKLPSGSQKYHWDKDDIEPFIKTQPILDMYEKQKINDRSQLRLFAPKHEIQEKDNKTIDVLTERPMTQTDENWAYAGVYNNKKYKKGN